MRAEQLPAGQGLPAAIIEGLESPTSAGSSVVAVAPRDDRSEVAFSDAFLARSQSSDIAGSVSLLNGDRFTAYDLPTVEYHIGTISWYTRMRIWLTRYFIPLVFVVMLLSLLLVCWVREYLADRAEERVWLGPMEMAVDSD